MQRNHCHGILREIFELDSKLFDCCQHTLCCAVVFIGITFAVSLAQLKSDNKYQASHFRA